MKRSGFRITPASYVKRTGFRRPKYGNVRCTCAHDHKHDSRVEAAFCDYLHLLQRGEVQMWGGAIKTIESQVTVDLDGICKYRADFAVTLRAVDGIEQTRHIDVKGIETDVFRIKRKLYDRLHPMVPLIVVKCQNGRWITVRSSE